MDTIFTLKDNDNSEKINLDDLYEKKKQQLDFLKDQMETDLKVN